MRSRSRSFSEMSISLSAAPSPAEREALRTPRSPPANASPPLVGALIESLSFRSCGFGRAASSAFEKEDLRLRATLPQRLRDAVHAALKARDPSAGAFALAEAPGVGGAANPWFALAPEDAPENPLVAFVNPRMRETGNIVLRDEMAAVGRYLELLSRCRGGGDARPIARIQAALITSGLLRGSVELHDALIRALASSGRPHAALPLYAHLLRAGLLPTPHTLPSLFKSLALSPAVPGARRLALAVHAHAVRLGLTGFLLVNNALIRVHAGLLGRLPDAHLLLRTSASVDASTFNTLITSHARAGRVADARSLFDEMPTRNVVSWSAMVNGYVQAGDGREALLVFSQMQDQGVCPDDTVLVGVLAACAQLGALEQGKWVHGYLKATCTRITVFLGTALVDMYAKCGEVQLGMEVFEGMKDKNVLTWTTMIKGLAMHGRGSDSLRLFSQMESLCVKPDDIAFIGAL
ncbi:hypothetical protein ACQ4PT_000587 [Festuca glaucescens]